MLCSYSEVHGVVLLVAAASVPAPDWRLEGGQASRAAASGHVGVMTECFTW